MHAHTVPQRIMIVFRISRDDEFWSLEPRKCRLYMQDAQRLIGDLNAAAAATARGPLVDLGPTFNGGRNRTPPSMDGAAESLMEIVSGDLNGASDEAWLGTAMACSFNNRMRPWLEAAATEYLAARAEPRKGTWTTFLWSSFLRRGPQLPCDKHTAAVTSTGPGTPTHFNDALHTLARDERLADHFIRLWLERKERGGAGFLAERRASMRSAAKGTVFPGDWVGRELEALELLERHLPEFDAFFGLADRTADLSVVLSAQVFGRWIDRKLKTAGLGFRLALDRRASTYRVAPSEAYSAPDSADDAELRLIRPHTILSACLIAYLALPGFEGRTKGWLEDVELIDWLAYGGALNRVLRCAECGRWMFALHRRRGYCGDACRYKAWARTPRGKHRRKEASSAWRRRFSEEVHRATPRVRPGRRKR